MKGSIVCNNCQAELFTLQRSHTCPQCSANDVEFKFAIENGEKPRIQQNESGIWRYKEFLPKFEHRISLDEGMTPIRKALHLFKNKLELSFKIEGNNPTGSFLDRISPLMVSDAFTQEMNSVVCASDGNLGASLSAYCAAAQLKCFCVVPKNTSSEKRTQMLAYGAEVVDFGNTIDDSLDLARKMIEKGRYQATPEFNILTIEGAKTISFELVEQFKEKKSIEAIEYIVVPMGSGSLLYSIWKGFKQVKEFKLIDEKVKLPKIIGVQAEGFDPITQSFDTGDELQNSDFSRTRKKSVAGAIQVRNPTFGFKAIQCINESNGIAISVSEEEIINASKLLGKKEGIFAELSSATVIAAIEKLHTESYFSENASVLALITSSGLKTSSTFQQSQIREKRVESFRSMGTKVEILQIIASHEADFGYGIWKALGQTISLQAVYQHLKELANQEFISEIDTSERQKKYSLTDKGKMLITKMEELEELLGK